LLLFILLNTYLFWFILFDLHLQREFPFIPNVYVLFQKLRVFFFQFTPPSLNFKSLVAVCQSKQNPLIRKHELEKVVKGCLIQWSLICYLQSSISFKTLVTLNLFPPTESYNKEELTRSSLVLGGCPSNAGTESKFIYFYFIF